MNGIVRRVLEVFAFSSTLTVILFALFSRSQKRKSKQRRQKRLEPVGEFRYVLLLLEGGIFITAAALMFHNGPQKIIIDYCVEDNVRMLFAFKWPPRTALDHVLMTPNLQAGKY